MIYVYRFNFIRHTTKYMPEVVFFITLVSHHYLSLILSFILVDFLSYQSKKCNSIVRITHGVKLGNLPVQVSSQRQFKHPVQTAGIS